ncbi:MAG: [protein-PII] uridylyltransferase [Pseudomonadota bacterium]
MTGKDVALVDKRTPSRRKPRKWRIDDIVDPRALRIKLTAAAFEHQGDDASARRQAIDILHGALFRGRMIAQERLFQGDDGLSTSRLLAAVQDEVLHALYDFTTTHVFRARNPTEGERLAVFATGGYGRGVLAPSSDIDLLFIRPYKASAHAESVIEFMLYALWDIGLKVGHAFRTPQECVKLARSDVTIKTSLLDARFLFGDKALADETWSLFIDRSVTGQDAQFIADKLEERDRRHTKGGDTRYVVEPNVKEGKGGLRDLQTLFWIVKHLHPNTTNSLEDVMQTQIFTKRETTVFMRAARFLWTVRCHLHYLTGRPEERLSFDLQPELAERMGYSDRREQRGVERFMKRYFVAAKDVGSLTRILAAKLEAEQQAKPEGWRRFFRGGGQSTLTHPDLTLSHERVAIIDEQTFLKSPANLLELFRVADREQRDIHPDAMSFVTRNSKCITTQARSDPALADVFFAILLDGNSPGLALDRMNEAGLLGRYIPEFGGIVAQTQFNMYHHYTVDEHTLRAVTHMANMQRGEDGFELAHGLFAQIENARALFLSMLLHDTGKGLGDQQIEGMKTARKACRRLGIGAEETELVAWLVGNHLEMSETAQKRDISDPSTIGRFAELVGDVQHMRLLYLLTVADIRAVGPNVWNSWKGQLLGDLYHSTEAVLRGGRTDQVAVAKELRVRAEANRAAVTQSVGTLPAVMQEMDDPYWTGLDTDTLAAHADLLSGDARSIVKVSQREGAGGTEVFVSGPDRKGLFARLVGAIDKMGANIISAHVFTAHSGRIVDVFFLHDDDGLPFAKGDVHRLKRLEEAVRVALDTDKVIDPPKIRPNARKAAFLVSPSVSFHDDVSEAYTVIDIAGRNRPGLLAELASLFAEADLSIVSAHVGSYGERVFDAFYVEPTGVFSQNDRETLRAKILEVLRREEPEGPSTPARKLRRASAADSF